MECEAFKHDRSQFFYEVRQRSKSGKELKSMPSDFVLVITHSLRKELCVGTGDGVFHPAAVHESLIALKSFVVDSSLFAFRDEDSLHCGVHRALSSAGVNLILWDAISDAVMVEGIRMVESNLQIYKGRNSECSGRFIDTVAVRVVTKESFVCYEDVGEC